MTYQIELHKSNRKSISLQIKQKGTLIIRAPKSTKQADIDRLIEKHRGWIEQNMNKVADRPEPLPKYTAQELETMMNQARNIIPPKVRYYANIIGVTYKTIYIKKQKTKWGSCSSLGNLNFNCLLTQVPEEVMDYVIVHELCHRKEMNHSKQFWNEVAKIMPNYLSKKEWLKKNGHLYIERL